MDRRSHLRTLLETHVPFDGEEARHLARMLTLLNAEGDPFSRDHMAPGHFTASAFILSPDAEALLLIYHGKLARWLQPGGHVDPGDRDILAAARREICEEVGLVDVPLELARVFDLDVHDIPAFKAEPPHAHFDVRFLFRAPSLAFQAGTDAKAARWVELSEIDAQLSDRSVLRAVDKLRSR